MSRLGFLDRKESQPRLWLCPPAHRAQVLPLSPGHLGEAQEALFSEMSSTPESQTPARGFRQTCVSTGSQDSGRPPPFLSAVSPRDQKACAVSLRSEHLILEATDMQLQTRRHISFSPSTPDEVHL